MCGGLLVRIENFLGLRKLILPVVDEVAIANRLNLRLNISQPALYVAPSPSDFWLLAIIS